MRRRDFLKGTGALGGAVLAGSLPRRSFAEAAKPTVVTFASPPFFGLDSITALLETYNAAQSAVRATYLELPSAGDSVALHADLVKRLQATDGSAPDIFSHDIVWVAEFAAAGLSLPLSDEFPADDMAAFFPGVVAGCTVDGALMAMPWFADSGMLFYRKDILARIKADVPQTWDQLAAAAKKGVGGDVRYGFLWQGRKSEALVCNAVSAIGSNGGAILAPDGKTVKIAQPEAVAAIKLLYNTIHHSKISPAEVLQWDEEPCRKPFNAGEAVFLRNWSYTWGLAQQKDSAIAGKIGVAPLPHFLGKSSAACLGGYQYGVNAASPNKAAAVDLLRWLSSQATQLHFATENGLAPTRQAVFDDPALAAAQPFLAQLKGVFVGALARPVTPKYPQVTLALQSALAAALATGDVAKELAGAKTRIEAILAG